MFATDKSFRVFVETDTGRGTASTIALDVFGSTTVSSIITGLGAEAEEVAAAEEDELLLEAELLARTGDLDFDLDLDPDPDLDRDFRVDTIL
jgi:hypothetical protein